MFCLLPTKTNNFRVAVIEKYFFDTIKSLVKPTKYSNNNLTMNGIDENTPFVWIVTCSTSFIYLGRSV